MELNPDTGQPIAEPPPNDGRAAVTLFKLNGKYYTEVKAFKIETVGKVASQQPSEEFEEPLF